MLRKLAFLSFVFATGLYEMAAYGRGAGDQDFFGNISAFNIIASGGGPVYDVTSKQFAGGADPTGATDSTAAIVATITAATPKRGQVYFPPGTFNHTGFTGANGVTFAGAGGQNTTNSATQLIYTGTGTRAIDIRSKIDVGFYNIAILYSSASFTGTLIDFSKSTTTPSVFRMDGCSVGGTTSSAGNAANLIDLHGGVNISIDRTTFGFGVQGILGRSLVGDLCNTVWITRCNVLGSALSTCWIRNAGQSWFITGNTIEPIVSGAPGAYIGDFAEEAFNFAGNWMGDLTQAGTWVTFNAAPLGVAVIGNRFGLAAIGTGVKFTANNPNGLTITGNEFNGSAGATGIDFGSITGTKRYFIGANIYSTNVTSINGSAQLILDGLIDNGSGLFVGSGRTNTGSRPAANGVGIGATYYDTTLSKPIWSDGTTWRDAAGTAV